MLEDDQVEGIGPHTDSGGHFDLETRPGAIMDSNEEAIHSDLDGG